MPDPIYTPNNLHAAAYQLRYSWSGWLSCSMQQRPVLLSDDKLGDLKSAWKTDGLHLLESTWQDDAFHFTFSAKPTVSPVLLATRAKGRLQHALRLNGTPVSFSRKLSVRSVGDCTREVVEEYVRRQVEKEPLADPGFRELLSEFTFVSPETDLSLASESESGRYWYNLHLVFVVQQRYRFGSEEVFGKLRDAAHAIAAKKRHAISALSVMPDHMHLALRGDIQSSPEEIALCYLNNLAYKMGQNAIWEFGYYAGTFGEYRMDAVRRRT